jgi:hypothetical protein
MHCRCVRIVFDVLDAIDHAVCNALLRDECVPPVLLLRRVVDARMSMAIDDFSILHLYIACELEMCPHLGC